MMELEIQMLLRMTFTSRRPKMISLRCKIWFLISRPPTVNLDSEPLQTQMSYTSSVNAPANAR
ncbi:hypothetical protein AHAS_Ahas04G0140500 [Arachis hypogaea]